jgi:hypothetical protein
VLRTEITSSNPRGNTQQLASSILGRGMTKSNAENALARSQSRSRSPVPTTQQSVQKTTRRRSSSIITDQVQSNIDAVAVVERVVTVVMDKLHPPVIISESVDSFARLIAMHDQARISGDHITEQYASAMLKKLADEAIASE